MGTHRQALIRYAPCAPLFLGGRRYGLECLFRFYSYGLEIRFRADLFDDFQELTRRDYNDGNLYGLEKLWAFLRYRPQQQAHDTTITLQPDLQQALAAYQRLDDFRVVLVPNKVRVCALRVCVRALRACVRALRVRALTSGWGVSKNRS